jgi:biopolymer transport protein ExbD
MDFLRLRTTLAPALSSVFVILLLCVFIIRRPHAQGMLIPLYPLHPESNPSGQSNHREIVLWLTRDGKMWMNDTEIRPDGLRAKIADVFESRALKKVYVVADSGVTYGQFADFMSRIFGASPNLNVILLSG